MRSGTDAVVLCRTLVRTSVFLLVMASAACSDDSGTPSETGGAPAVTGGSAGTQGGGAPAAGGAISGGNTASGGATGGVSFTGGAPASGATGGGGMPETGGAPLVGGTGGAGAGGIGASPGTGAAGGGSGGDSTGGSGGASGGSETGGTGGAVAGFMPCPTTPGTTCNIMPVGDSITEGCCTPPMGGYRIELYRQALLDQKDITFVGTLNNGPETVDNEPFPKQHEGHGGWKISQIAGVIDGAIAASSPHIVLLKIGTNDINGNDNIASAPNRLRSLIDQITSDAPSALLVVSAIIPTTNDGTNQKVEAYNAAIQTEAEAAAAEGQHVVFLDNYAVFLEHSDYKTALMADGLHPNNAGYAVLGQAFYDVINGLLPELP